MRGNKAVASAPAYALKNSYRPSLPNALERTPQLVPQDSAKARAAWVGCPFASNAALGGPRRFTLDRVAAPRSPSPPRRAAESRNGDPVPWADAGVGERRTMLGETRRQGLSESGGSSSVPISTRSRAGS